ncbi:hypothetical protein [Streptomyces sp. HSG2]|uniref:hypothetical protein n=1 Tax=Streptomyces sp. HSG2 TaxID=2797167 RepID=UPI0019046ED7|nr:hypothetical protein [Streptomyces sp. HSG2]
MDAQIISDGESAGGAVVRNLIFGDVAHQYTVAPHSSAPLLAVGLEDESGGSERALEFLRPAGTAARSLSLVPPNGPVRKLSEPTEPFPTWDFTGFTTELEQHAQLSGDLGSLVPLMMLRTHTNVSRPYTEVLVLGRVRSIGVLFVRVARFDHPARTDIADLVRQALTVSDAMTDYVRIEGNAYFTYEQGIEIERKVNLLDEVSIWELTRDMWQSIEAREFDGFITDPGYEFTRWHFVQHNFEVIDPDSEVGHIAFQECPNGKYQLKQKKFREDSLRREEIFRKGVEVANREFEEYLAREYPLLTFRRLPSFTRTRFDLNVISTVTGHCFGIETDEIAVIGAPEQKLRQVEIEYLETRQHEGMDAASIDTDLDLLTRLVEKHLHKRGTVAERSFYSKLSFLKDCMKSPAVQYYSRECPVSV